MTPLVLLPDGTAINPAIIYSMEPCPGEGVLIRTCDTNHPIYCADPEWGTNPDPIHFWNNPKITNEVAKEFLLKILRAINGGQYYEIKKKQ